MSIIILQYVFPFLLLVFWPFFPESADYLIKRNRFDEARKALYRAHGTGDED